MYSQSETFHVALCSWEEPGLLAGISKESFCPTKYKIYSIRVMQYFMPSLDDLLYFQERFQHNSFTALTFKNYKLK